MFDASTLLLLSAAVLFRRREFELGPVARLRSPSCIAEVFELGPVANLKSARQHLSTVVRLVFDVLARLSRVGCWRRTCHSSSRKKSSKMSLDFKSLFGSGLCEF